MKSVSWLCVVLFVLGYKWIVPFIQLQQTLSCHSYFFFPLFSHFLLEYDRGMHPYIWSHMCCNMLKNFKGKIHLKKFCLHQGLNSDPFDPKVSVITISLASPGKIWSLRFCISSWTFLSGYANYETDWFSHRAWHWESGKIFRSCNKFFYLRTFLRVTACLFNLQSFTPTQWSIF